MLNLIEGNAAEDLDRVQSAPENVKRFGSKAQEGAGERRKAQKERRESAGKAQETCKKRAHEISGKKHFLVTLSKHNVFCASPITGEVF